MKETLWNRSEKVDYLANKYWYVLQGSGIIKMIIKYYFFSIFSLSLSLSLPLYLSCSPCFPLCSSNLSFVSSSILSLSLSLVFFLFLLPFSIPLLSYPFSISLIFLLFDYLCPSFPLPLSVSLLSSSVMSLSLSLVFSSFLSYPVFTASLTI